MEKIPPDLKRVLSANPEAKAKWNDLTPVGRRDFLSWIESAKLPETRKRRVDSVPSRLASGKRRPCCYAVVPMNLYTALNASPKAKEVWKELSPDAKRDFIDWIDGAKDKQEREVRVAQTSMMLAKGKKKP